MTEETGKVRLGGIPIALAAFVLYTAGMAGVWTFAEHDYSETALLLRDVIVALGGLVLLTLALAWWSGITVHRSNRLGLFGGLAMIPVLLILATFGASAASGITDGGLIVTVLIGTLLVGIGEETAFRGLALNGLAMKMSLPWAVVLSSVLFGLMHSVNVMLQPADTTVQQVIQTSLVGLFFGWTYVLTGGNLVLVVVLHWLWDFGLIATQLTEETVGGFAGVGTLVALLLAIGFTIYGFVKLRGMSWADWDAKRTGVAEPASV